MYERGTKLSTSLSGFRFTNLPVSFTASNKSKFTDELLLNPDFISKLKSLYKLYGEVIILEIFKREGRESESLMNLAELLNIPIQRLQINSSIYANFKDYIDYNDQELTDNDVWVIKNNHEFINALQQSLVGVVSYSKTDELVRIFTTASIVAKAADLTELKTLSDLANRTEVLQKITISLESPLE